MERIWYFKLSIVAAILLACGVCIWGALPESYQLGFIRDHVNTELQLGLDLRGGVRLQYEVLIDDALRQRRHQTAEGLRMAVTEDLHVEKVAYREFEETRFYLLFESQADASKCNHAFIRQNGWAEDVSRGAASEAHFELAEGATRSTREAAEATKRTIQQRLNLQGLEVETLPSRRFAVIFPDVAGLDRLEGEAVEGLSDVTLVGRFKRRIELRLADEAYESIVETAVNQAREVIENRIDELGVANMSVSSSGTNIIIEIPAGSTAGGEDEERQSEFVARTKRIIERTARLEFQIADDRERNIYAKLRPLVQEDDRVELVPDDSTFFLRASDTKTSDGTPLPGNKILADFIALAQEKGVDIPENRVFRFEEITPRRRGKKAAAPVDKVWRSWFLDSRADVTGEHISDARVAYEQQGPRTGQPYVSLSFNDRGRKAFGALTKANVGKRLAIVLDDRVNSAPVIEEAILGGTARITMGGYGDQQETLNDSKELVIVLRAGGLPAPITLINEETIGPQLGADSIRRGEIALLVGSVIVILFMLIYYKVAGLIADLALMSNVVMIFAALGLLGATLTLPGLAGIVLTIGMAVDANIIIYERIREELRAGKSPRAAVDSGYARAFWTVFDAQFTTLIAGVVLLDQGTGPIKGFAVTLLIGIVTSMVSAIFFSRVAFDWITRRKRLERLSI